MRKSQFKKNDRLLIQTHQTRACASLMEIIVIEVASNAVKVEYGSGVQDWLDWNNVEYWVLLEKLPKRKAVRRLVSRVRLVKIVNSKGPVTP